MTTDQLEYAESRGDEIDTLNALLEQALVFAVGGMAIWTDMLGHEHTRVVRRQGQVVAGLAVIPFGHYFGGNVVRAGGVTAVGVRPDQRGSGVGLFMIRQMLVEQRAAGVPIATLYPATTAFYRKAGFERAANRLIYEMPLAAIGLRDYTLDAAPVQPGDYSVIKQLYARRAAQTNGFMDRPDFYWRRILEQPEKPTYTFVATRGGVAEGYVIFGHAVWGEPLAVRDLVALTPEAGRRLLTILADHRSVIDTVRFPAAPNDPLLFLMPEQNPTIYRSFDLMLRVLDVPAALMARGYTIGVTAEIHLEVTDDLFAQNNQRFVLQVADGRGTVEPGGRGSFKLSIRDLAALYTGYYTPGELCLASAISADEASLAAAALIFGGARPWLPDMF